MDKMHKLYKNDYKHLTHNKYALQKLPDVIHYCSGKIKTMIFPRPKGPA